MSDPCTMITPSVARSLAETLLRVLANHEHHAGIGG